MNRIPLSARARSSSLNLQTVLLRITFVLTSRLRSQLSKTLLQETSIYWRHSLDRLGVVSQNPTGRRIDLCLLQYAPLMPHYTLNVDQQVGEGISKLTKGAMLSG